MHLLKNSTNILMKSKLTKYVLFFQVEKRRESEKSEISLFLVYFNETFLFL